MTPKKKCVFLSIRRRRRRVTQFTWQLTRNYVKIEYEAMLQIVIAIINARFIAITVIIIPSRSRAIW